VTDEKKPLQVELQASRHILDWLEQEKVSLALTTYQSGRLMLLGYDREKKRLAGFERHFDRAMGLWCSPERLLLANKLQVWQLDQALRPGQVLDGHDALYVPRVGHTTGDLDVHDITVDARGRVLFACTGLNCIATLSERHSATPLWRPPFISKLVAEDRCHLNGLALRDGAAAFVTCISRSDVIDGWRDRRQDGGLALHVPSGEVVVDGLSMPHSPRWHRDRLWLLNSGKGELGYVEDGRFVPVVFAPGYLRGLAFHGDFAIVGLSKPREKTFKGLPLDDLLARKLCDPRCGLAIVDLRSGTIAHTLWLEGVVTELYDVGVLAGVRRPKALGFHGPELATFITLDPQGAL
jgi:protein O-GlcNAc transferase